MSLYAIGLTSAKWCAHAAGWTATILSPFIVIGAVSTVGMRMDDETRHRRRMQEMQEEAERIRLGLPEIDQGIQRPRPATASR